MNTYFADFHLHSRYSRATSPDCSLEGLAHWAQKKGVGVVGTGDCTHPQWILELREKLIPDAPGLYRLRSDSQTLADEGVPDACRSAVRFLVTGEISSIYTRGGRCHKVHSVVLFPSLADAEKLNVRLAAIGNIHSDGRPILKLDPRDLLSMMRGINSRAVLIPAHIWTPWFSMLGAKSGFDSLEECFGDEASEIFAVETGLSSDAPMNARIRCLDNLALVSDSDLHSPANLGRNANMFFGSPSYDAMMNGLREKDLSVCGGTVDLFPEEGKYYLDGHRACKVCLTPEESMAVGNLCPVCGKPLTIGVLHRVIELERKQPRPPDPSVRRLPYHYIIPLPELLGKLFDVAPTSKKVKKAFDEILSARGSELPLLLSGKTEDLGDVGAMIEAVRQGKVIRSGGYDGVYGTVKAAW